MVLAEVEEEVFAEDYDDHEDDGRTKSLSHYDDKNTHAKDDVSFMVRWVYRINCATIDKNPTCFIILISFFEH